jgi:hypothetical protein
VPAGGPSSQNMDSIPHLNCEVRLGCLGGGWVGCLCHSGVRSALLKFALEASKYKLSSRIGLTCLTAYLVSFRQRTAIYLSGPRRLVHQPFCTCQGCDPPGQLFKTCHSMSPGRPPYGWCETTRGAHVMIGGPYFATDARRRACSPKLFSPVI